MIVKNPSILFYNTETGIKRKVSSSSHGIARSVSSVGGGTPWHYS